MSERRVGFTVSGDKVVVVDALVPDEGPIVLQADHSWNLQKGDREDAYHVLYQQVTNYLREHDIRRVALKASSANARGMTQAHLDSAEVRGIIIAAARSICPVRSLKKGAISKTFGTKKVDEYVKDNDFWRRSVEGVSLRAGSREAAMMLLADRNAS